MGILRLLHQEHKGLRPAGQGHHDAGRRRRGPSCQYQGSGPQKTDTEHAFDGLLRNEHTARHAQVQRDAPVAGRGARVVPGQGQGDNPEREDGGRELQRPI